MIHANYVNVSLGTIYMFFQKGSLEFFGGRGLDPLTVLHILIDSVKILSNLKRQMNQHLEGVWRTLQAKGP